MARRIRIAVLLAILVASATVLANIRRSLHPRIPLEVEAALADEVTRTDPAAGGGCTGLPLPDNLHYTPDGVCVGLVAAGHGRLRQLAFASNGDLFGVNRTGEILRFRDLDGNGFFEKGDGEVLVWAETGGNGNDLHIDEDGGFLYAGSPSGVRRWAFGLGADTAGDSRDVVVDMPASGHGTHTAHLWDGFLYVQSGSAGNATSSMSPAYDTHRSLIKRFPIAELPEDRAWSWDEGEVFVVGLRNTNGFARRSDGRLWGVVNGLDEVHYRGQDVHQDNPGEQIVLLEKGKRYGYPFCFTAQRVVAATGFIPAGTQLTNEIFEDNPHDDAWCAANSDPPATFVQAHSAPLDLVFFEAQPAGSLPERWRGGAFIALHGSWNRDDETGSKVIWLPFDSETGMPPMPTSTPDATHFPYEVVFGGGRQSLHADGGWAWNHETLGPRSVRPAGVAISPIDGALFVSSDRDGDLYRIALEESDT